MNARIALRRLRDDEADYRLLEAWCCQEEIYRYFEQRILIGEEIPEIYVHDSEKVKENCHEL